MAKTKTTYFCKNCGMESAKWIGRCPGCGEWNTMTEEPVVSKSKLPMFNTSDMQRNRQTQAIKIGEIKAEDLPRIKLPSNELNRVLGGGLVPGSIILIGGEPGIGKSTLVLN